MKIGLALFLALLTTAVHAGLRNSASYSVITDSSDAAGARVSSTSYTHDGSMGGITGISTVSSPAEFAKHGYIGQLYVVTGLALSSTSNTLLTNSGTAQLGASQTLDDGTTLVLSPSSVTWSVVSGPIASISSSGLATAGAVNQSTSATVKGTFGGNSSTLDFTVMTLATTQMATSVLSKWTLLNGSANPGGATSTAYFQYGASTSYGSTTPVTNIGSGTADLFVGFNLDGLTPGTTYHYRLVVVSGGVTYDGADMTFTTPATSPATWHSAQVTALTNPNLANMADGARTGVAQPNANLYFYKGTDNNIWAVFLGATAWQQQQLTTIANVSDWLAYEPNYGLLCYKGTDGNLWCVYFNTATAKWTSTQLGSPPQGVTIAGDLVVDSSGGWNNIYYRGSDSHLYAAYLSGGNWVHLPIGGTATVKGNLAVEDNNHLVYYQSTDNNIWCFYNNGKAWSQLQLTTTGNVGGAVAVDNQGLLAYYKSNADTSAWCTYPTGANWAPVQLDATANMNSSATSFSNIAPYNGNDCTLYLDNNGQCDSLFWNGKIWTHVILGDGGTQLTGGLSLQPTNHWLFARRSDGNVILFYIN